MKKWNNIYALLLLICTSVVNEVSGQPFFNIESNKTPDELVDKIIPQESGILWWGNTMAGSFGYRSRGFFTKNPSLLDKPFGINDGIVLANSNIDTGYNCAMGMDESINNFVKHYVVGCIDTTGGLVYYHPIVL